MIVPSTSLLSEPEKVLLLLGGESPKAKAVGSKAVPLVA